MDTSIINLETVDHCLTCFISGNKNEILTCLITVISGVIIRFIEKKRLLKNK